MILYQWRRLRIKILKNYGDGDRREPRADEP
jgi:hypothetical protein